MEQSSMKVLTQGVCCLSSDMVRFTQPISISGDVITIVWNTKLVMLLCGIC